MSYVSPLRSKLPCIIESEFMADGKVAVHRYELLEEIGRGGMGTVYRAHDLGRPTSVLDCDTIVAVKYIDIPPAGPDETFENRPEEHKRFEREYQLAAKIHHPNFVRVFDMGVDQEGCTFTVMELVQNARTLADIIEKSARQVNGVAMSSVVDTDLLLSVMSQVAQGIKVLHEFGIIHRDIKPDNILVKEVEGVVVAKIFDLGIAKDTTDKRSRSQALTQEGSTLGTPFYMSPEQWASNFCTATDWWAFGVMLYESLTGKYPFEGPTLPATMLAIVNADPRPLEDSVVNVDPSLKRLVDGCLRKNPDTRMQASEVLALLDEAEARFRKRAAGSKLATLEFKPEPIAEVVQPETRLSAVEHAFKLIQSRPKYLMSFMAGVALIGVIGTIAFMLIRRPSEPAGEAAQGAPLAEPVEQAQPRAAAVARAKKRAPGSGPQSGTQDHKRTQSGFASATSGVRQGSQSVCSRAIHLLLPIALRYKDYREPKLALAECYLVRKQPDDARDFATQYLEYEGSTPDDFSPSLRKLVAP